MGHTVIDAETQLPLFGLDFLGIVDRGTNVLEIKTHTLCQFKCKYCFVSAGEYHNNFSLSPDYLVTWLHKALQFKECNDMELHFAPYGEILLYKPFVQSIREMRDHPKVKTISAQSNGMLLTPQKVKDLDRAGLDRINISLNSMDAEVCADLCGIPAYDLEHMLSMFDEVLHSGMELCIAPVWFMGKNDKGILEIIKYALKKKKEGFDWPKLRIGIQNYLEYKTGRKLGGVFGRDFSYFYQQLGEMEQNYGLKLKLGPLDFGIHSANPISSPFQVGATSQVQVIMKGRFKNEYIAALNPQWAIKVLSKQHLRALKIYQVKYIKSTLSRNLMTAIKEV